MEFRYLKPILKSGKSTIGIWRAITLGVKDLLHFLEKESYMNSNIYINQVLEELDLPFYKQSIRENGPMIWINDSADYHTSKTIAEYQRLARLICID